MQIAGVNVGLPGTLGVDVPKPAIDLKASTKADVTAAHSQDTYGQLVVYVRLNGVTPPFSRQP